jgi:hypothetical protein
MRSNGDAAAAAPPPDAGFTNASIYAHLVRRRLATP